MLKLAIIGYTFILAKAGGYHLRGEVGIVFYVETFANQIYYCCLPVAHHRVIRIQNINNTGLL